MRILVIAGRALILLVGLIVVLYPYLIGAEW